MAAALIGATTSWRPTSSATAPRVEASVPPAFRVVPRVAASPAACRTLFDALRCDVLDGGGDVAGVVDGLRGAEAADVLLLLPGLGGADDGRAGSHGQLHGDGSRPRRSRSDENRLAGLHGQRLQRVVCGHTGQADDGGLLRVDAGRDA